jgi:NADH-quinone oxidoreductase subunit M
MFFGPLSNPKNKKLADLNPREIFVVSPLIVLIFVMGLFPSIFLDRMTDAVNAFDARYRDTFEVAKMHGNSAAELVEIGDASFMKGAPEIGAAAAPSREGAE